jgi:hypothetical protein
MTRHQRLARTALIALSIALPGTHLAAGPANSLEVYLDKSTFLSSTGATEASTPFPVADEGPLASRTVGDVTYVAPRF